MKKFALALGTIGLAAVSIPAIPAMAAPVQRYGHVQQTHNNWVSVNKREARLKARINFGLRTRQLSLREARSLRLQLQQIERLERRYRMTRPGLTRAEMRDLDRRMDNLSRRIMREVRDRNGRVG